MDKSNNKLPEVLQEARIQLNRVFYGLLSVVVLLTSTQVAQTYASPLTVVIMIGVGGFACCVMSKSVRNTYKTLEELGDDATASMKS